MGLTIYTVTFTGGSSDMSSGGMTSAVIVRTGGDIPPENSYVVSSEVTISNFYCYSSRKPYLEFNNAMTTGTYFGFTDGLSQHNSLGSETVNATMNDSILSVDTGGAYAVVIVQGGGTGRQVGFRANTTIEIRVNWALKITSSTAIFEESVTAGEELSVVIVNDLIGQ